MIFTKKFPKSITAECYRNIRTGLEYSSIDKKLRTIVVTSSEAGEGKSTVSSNLAYVLSQSGKKVILIDCDLRKPSLHRVFEKSNDKGLTDYLIGKYSLDNVIKQIDNNLYLLTSGDIPPNPAEVIESQGMENLLEKLKDDFEHIILDTPPVRAVTDGQILAGKSDGTLLVVRAEKTSSDSIIQGYKELEKVRAKVLGSIINGASSERREAYYYDYSNDRRKKKKNK